MTTQTEVLKLARGKIGAAQMCHPSAVQHLLGEAWDLLNKALARPEDPLSTPLPCDVKVGHVTICKGVELRVLVARMKVLYDLAQSAMAQPEQEPAAYIQHHKGGDNLEWDDPGGKRTPLYTTPPERKPLTDEEIAKIASTPAAVVGSYVHTFARAIEAAHNIKE